MQCNKTSYLLVRSNPYFLPAADKYANLSPPDFFFVQQEKTTQVNLLKNSLCKNVWVKKLWNTGSSQEMAVMVGQWQNFNSDNSGELVNVASSQLHWESSPKFTWIVVIKICLLPTNTAISWLPPVFHNFSPRPFAYSHILS